MGIPDKYLNEMRSFTKILSNTLHSNEIRVSKKNGSMYKRNEYFLVNSRIFECSLETFAFFQQLRNTCVLWNSLNYSEYLMAIENF